jgi:hypothetical protein
MPAPGPIEASATLRTSGISAAAPAVDVALVLSIDCSSSMDDGDYHIVMTGIAAALADPAVVAAATSSGGHADSPWMSVLGGCNNLSRMPHMCSKRSSESVARSTALAQSGHGGAAWSVTMPASATPDLRHADHRGGNDQRRPTGFPEGVTLFTALLRPFPALRGEALSTMPPPRCR